MSCPELRTKFNFMKINKTNIDIQRSQSLQKFDLSNPTTFDESFSLIVIDRLKSWTSTGPGTLPNLLEYFCCETPLLEKLDVEISSRDSTFFNGDFTSLRKLSLRGNIVQFPWKNLANLETVWLKNYTSDYELTALLDFFESAPLLHTVVFNGRIHGNLSERRVHLDHLRYLKVYTPPGSDGLDGSHSTLFRHLHIPIGASLTSSFHFRHEFPLLDYLQGGVSNFNSLSPVTAVHLLCSREKKVRVSGPNGCLYLEATWESEKNPWIIDSEVLCSLDHPMLSKIRRLTISDCGYQSPGKIRECSVFKMLCSKKDLRALTLIHCNSQPFILALDPEQVPSDSVLCPNMEKLEFYLLLASQLNVKSLIKMVKARASKGMKPLSITIIFFARTMSEEDAIKFREYTPQLEYRVDAKYPQWDDIPCEDDSESK